jgi:hypothetical protein
MALKYNWHTVSYRNWLWQKDLARGAALKFDMETFHLKKLNDVEVKEQ